MRWNCSGCGTSSITCPCTNSGSTTCTTDWPVCYDTTGCSCSACQGWNGICNPGSTCGSGCTGVCTDACATPCANTNCSCSGDRPALPWGYLLPRIVGVGRIWQRNYSTTLCVTDLPDCAEGPFTLISVSACDQAAWDVIPGESGRPCLVRLTIPLSVQIRDCSCTLRTVHASITLEVPLRLHCPAQDMWRGTLLIYPSVRLVSCPCPSNDGCFEVVLEVRAEVYMVRWEAKLQNGWDDWNDCTNRPGCTACTPCNERPCCR